MSDKEQVYIQIISIANGNTSIEQATGMLFRKSGELYLHYCTSDSADGDGISTIIKVAAKNALRIIRRGEVETNLLFMPGKKTKGTVRTGAAVQDLVIATSLLDNCLRNGIGTISWTYSLYVDDLEAGTFQLSLQIEPFVK